MKVQRIKQFFESKVRVKNFLKNDDISPFVDTLYEQFKRNPMLFLQFLKDPNPIVRYNTGIVITWMFEPLLHSKEPLFNPEKTKFITDTIEKVLQEEQNTTDIEWKKLLNRLIYYRNLYKDGIA